MSETGVQHDGSRDFDFWFGHWRIENQRLLKRLEGCTEWETFLAEGHAWALPGGIGNMDDFVPDNWRPGFVGMTLRLFNPSTARWKIYWMSNATGTLEQPVEGRFQDGVGIFEGEDVFEGRPIHVRFEWSEITPNSALWHQSFSNDGGLTWEKNWVMRMSRIVD